MFVLTNAHILTMDPHRPHAGTVSIADGRIVALDGHICADAHMIDCRGGVLLPGFVDPHVHLLATAAALRSIDCSPRAVRSITDIQEALAAAATVLAPGVWLRAWGYDESALVEERHPTRWDLDAAVPNRPVRLLHRSGHAAVLNSAALMLAGIDIASEEPPGGVIDRRLDDGEPTGLLIDMEATVERVVPALPREEMVAGMSALSESLVRAGVTAVQDMTHRNNAARLALLDQVRIASGFAPRMLPPATAPGEPGTGPVKLMLREAGAISATQRKAVLVAASGAHGAGRQLAIHAVTEAGVRLALDAIEAALVRDPRPGHRHRIEHAALCPPALAQRAAALGVLVVSNPAFLHDGGDRYLRRVPADALPHLYAAGALVQAGVTVAAASDAPVTPPSPLSSIGAAINRRSGTGAPIPGLAARLTDALVMVTRAAAICAFAERIAGTIAEGMPADLVLISGLPAAGAPAPAVWWTMCGGELLHVSPDAPPAE